MKTYTDLKHCSVGVRSCTLKIVSADFQQGFFGVEEFYFLSVSPVIPSTQFHNLKIHPVKKSEVYTVQYILYSEMRRSSSPLLPFYFSFSASFFLFRYNIIEADLFLFENKVEIKVRWLSRYLMNSFLVLHKIFNKFTIRGRGRSGCMLFCLFFKRRIFIIKIRSGIADSLFFKRIFQTWIQNSEDIWTMDTFASL